LFFDCVECRETVASRPWPSTTLLVVNASELDRRRQALDRMVEIADEAGMYEQDGLTEAHSMTLSAPAEIARR